MYWVVFAVFSVVEFFSDIIMGWVPFYWLGKCAFLLWCMSPLDGSTVIYSKLILPWFKKNESEFDKIVGAGKNKLSNIADQAISAGTAMAMDGVGDKKVD